MSNKNFIISLLIVIWFQVTISEIVDLRLKNQEYKTLILNLRKTVTQLKNENKELSMVWEKYSTIDDVINCESGGKHDVWGDLDYKYPAFGKLQFQRRTFNWLSDKSNNTDLHWKNSNDQIFLFNWAMENNYGHLWTCYRKLLKKEGKTL